MNKIFISSDIEGTTGICNWADTHKDKEDYGYFRTQMAKEVAAVCEGAHASGVSDILVKDAHGDGCNIMHEMLPEYVKMMRGWGSTPLGMLCGIDESYDGVILTGAHIGADNSESPLAHTMNKQNNYVELNGSRVGETLFCLYTAAYFGVPVIMVTGDNGVCDYFKRLNPNIETVCVNEGIGNGVISIHPNVAVKRIREAAERACAKDPKLMLVELPKHFTVKINFKELSRAKSSSYYPGAKLIDSRTVQFEADDFFDVLRFNHFVLESIVTQAVKIPSL